MENGALISPDYITQFHQKCHLGPFVVVGQ